MAYERHNNSAKSRSPAYHTWSAMKQRCQNTKHSAFYRYGGRGIKVCGRWDNSFSNFLEDMGDRPEGLSLDRVNNDGNYEPGNCRWATRSEQSQNRQDVKLKYWMVECMRDLYFNQNTTQDWLSNCFGVTQSHICRIMNKECW